MSTPRRSTGRGRARPTATTSSTIARSTPSSAARRRSTVCPTRCGSTASASSSTSCRTTWASAAPTTRPGSRRSNGASSRRDARAFDIDWERLGANRKLVVPFLGDRYGDALDKGELKLALDAAEGSFSVWHYEHRFPICPLSFPIILDRALVALGEIGTESSAHLLAASERLRIMSEETVPERRTGFPEEAEGLKAQIAAATARLAGPAGRDRTRRHPHQRHLRHSGKLRHAPPHPRGAVLPASPLAHGGERHQLSSFLRHQRARRACASRNPRSSPVRTKRCSASSAKAGSTGCASIISMGLPTPPPMSRRCNGRSGRGSTSSSRRSSSRAKRCGAGRSPAPPATTP